MAAVLHIFSTITNLFFNPFAITEMLDARAGGVCPNNALQHSALREGWMALLSLDGAFSEAYLAGHDTWDVVVWLIDSIFPTSSVIAASSSLLLILIHHRHSWSSHNCRSIAQLSPGAAVIGDASHAWTLFYLRNWASTFDVGAEQFIEEERRRRRHLLASGGGGGGGKCTPASLLPTICATAPLCWTRSTRFPARTWERMGISTTRWA